MGSCSETRKAFQGPTYGRMRCSSKIYWSWSKHKGLSLGAWNLCLIFVLVVHLCPIVEEVQPHLQQAQKKGLGPESMCHRYQSLVQLSLYPHGCYGKRSEWTGKRMLPEKVFVKLWLNYIKLGKELAGFQTNQSLSQSFTGLCWALPLSNRIPFPG